MCTKCVELDQRNVRSTATRRGQDPEATGFYPNITPTHIGDWSEQEVAEMLKTARRPIMAACRMPSSRTSNI